MIPILLYDRWFTHSISVGGSAHSKFIDPHHRHQPCANRHPRHKRTGAVTSLFNSSTIAPAVWENDLNRSVNNQTIQMHSCEEWLFSLSLSLGVWVIHWHHGTLSRSGLTDQSCFFHSCLLSNQRIVIADAAYFYMERLVRTHDKI